LKGIKVNKKKHNMAGKKTIHIGRELQEQFANYCKLNGLKIQFEAEKIIRQYLETK